MQHELEVVKVADAIEDKDRRIEDLHDEIAELRGSVAYWKEAADDARANLASAQSELAALRAYQHLHETRDRQRMYDAANQQMAMMQQVQNAYAQNAYEQNAYAQQANSLQALNWQQLPADDVEAYRERFCNCIPARASFLGLGG